MNVWNFLTWGQNQHPRLAQEYILGLPLCHNFGSLCVLRSLSAGYVLAALSVRRNFWLPAEVWPLQCGLRIQNIYKENLGRNFHHLFNKWKCEVEIKSQLGSVVRTLKIFQLLISALMEDRTHQWKRVTNYETKTFIVTHSFTVKTLYTFQCPLRLLIFNPSRQVCIWMWP